MIQNKTCVEAEQIEPSSILNNDTNFAYSVLSIDTICQFVKAFERHNLCTRIGKEYLEIAKDYFFTTEKVFYFYQHLKAEKINSGSEIQKSGNIVVYLLEQLAAKIEKSMKIGKIYNFQLENFALMNLFLIKKILLNYSFYFHKIEIVSIFNSLKFLKTLPSPISNLAHDLMEDFLLESQFQGMNFINKFREVFYVDFLDKSVTEIDPTFFNEVVLVYSEKWDHLYKNNVNSGTPETFDLEKFLQRLQEKERDKHDRRIVLKEFLLKVLLTFFYNSSLNYDEKTFKSLFCTYLPNYVSLYQESEEKSGRKEASEEEIFSGSKIPLEKILKILDTGADKTSGEFERDVEVACQSLLKATTPSSITEDDLILYSDFFLPVTS